MGKVEWAILTITGLCILTSWLFPPWHGIDARHFLFDPPPGMIEVNTGRWVLQGFGILALATGPFLLARRWRERHASRVSDSEAL